MKMENIATQDRKWFNPKRELYWCKTRVCKVGKPPNHPSTLWKIGEISHFSPLLSKTWSTPTPKKNEVLKQRGWERDISHNIAMVLFIAKTKRLECPYGLKGKLRLMKDSLVWLPLHRTRRHRTDHLLLHFQATSVMLPCAPPAVAPSPVLWKN
jgi:hypothetical protein